MDLQLKGKMAIVTGGAGGIGRGIAIVLGTEGVNVAIVDVNAEGLAQVAKELKAMGVDSLAIEADCTNVDKINGAVERVIKRFGRVDILVNNVGGSFGTRGPITDIEKLDEQEYYEVIDRNLKGTFFFTKAVIPYMKANRYGKIVNLASITGLRAMEMSNLQYSTAKAGVIGFTRKLARDIGQYGINVNAIAPGTVKSGPRMESIWKTRDEGAFLKTVPLGRFGTVIDQAKVVAFLCSDAASYVTGVTIAVDGGWTI